MADVTPNVVPSSDEWRRQSGITGPAGVSRGAALVVGGLIIVGLLGLIVGLIELLGRREPIYVVTLPIEDYDTEWAPNAYRDADLIRRAIPKGNDEDASKVQEAYAFVEKLNAIGEGRLLGTWNDSRKLKKDIPFVFFISALGDIQDGQVVIKTKRDNLNRETVPLQAVLDALEKCPSDQKLLLLDLTRPRANLFADRFEERLSEALDNELTKWETGEKRKSFILTSSSKPNEVSVMIPQVGQSAFAYYLASGLEGWADHYNETGKKDGVVMVRELASYVSLRVNRWADRNRRHSQTPKLYGPQGGKDFKLVTPEKPKPVALKNAEGEDTLSPRWTERPDRAKEGLLLIEEWKERATWSPQQWQTFSPLISRYDATLIQAERRFAATGKYEPELTICRELRKEISEQSIREPTRQVPEWLTLHRFASFQSKLPTTGTPDPLKIYLAAMDSVLKNEPDAIAKFDSALEPIQAVSSGLARLLVWQWLGKVEPIPIARIRSAQQIMSQIKDDRPHDSIEEKTLVKMNEFCNISIYNNLADKYSFERFLDLNWRYTNQISIWLKGDSAGFAVIREEAPKFWELWSERDQWLSQSKKIDNQSYSTSFQDFVNQFNRLSETLKFLQKQVSDRVTQNKRSQAASQYQFQMAYACAEYAHPSFEIWKGLSDPNPESSLKVIQTRYQPDALTQLKNEAIEVKSVEDFTRKLDVIDKLDAVLTMPIVVEPLRSDLMKERNRIADFNYELIWKLDIEEDRDQRKTVETAGASINPRTNRRKEIAETLWKLVERPQRGDGIQKWQLLSIFPIGLMPSRQAIPKSGNANENEDWAVFLEARKNFLGQTSVMSP